MLFPGFLVPSASVGTEIFPPFFLLLLLLVLDAAGFFLVLTECFQVHQVVVRENTNFQKFYALLLQNVHSLLSSLAESASSVADSITIEAHLLGQFTELL